MLPGRHSTLIYGCILVSFAGLLKSECRHYFTADHSLRTFRSQHKTSGGSCNFYIRPHRSSTSNIFIRIYFPYLDPLPYHICTEASVKVYDGFDLVGKYCDMNSTLIQSSQELLTLKSWTSGATFDFHVVYCLDPFSKPPKLLFREHQLLVEPIGLPPIWIATISVTVFLFIFIFGCLVNNYCKRREMRSGSHETRGSNSAVVDSADPPAYSTLSTTVQQNANDRDELAPPANHNSVYVNPIFEPDPPSYWSVYAAGRPAFGKSYLDTPPSYEFAATNPS